MKYSQGDEYGSVAKFYDYVTPYRERGDVDFFVEAAREANGPVLELGCGTGRVLVPTAQAGIDITGFDSSETMLSICKRKLAAEPKEVQSRVQFVQGDMRHFDLGKTFKLITIPFRPFQHLVTVEDQISCLTNIRRHLADGGKLVFDVFNPSMQGLLDEVRLQETDDIAEITMLDGRKMKRRFRVASRDYFRQVQDIELIYYVTHPDGRQERLVHAFPMRYFFRYEVEHLLVRCGFKVEAVYSSFAKEPFGAKYPGEIIMVASKA
ncbi:MAG TPA: class I SAM-dependent methyltransferase [Candidatus Kapabacteria bacterium]|nr:class I SAM-dependent methyltransferase [Candidatus Kapabacteria bacterium]